MISRLMKISLLAAACGAFCLAGTAQAQKARLGHAMPTEHPQAQAMDKFAELAAQYTNNRVQIQVYHGSTLGGDDKMLQATQAGTQEIYFGALQPISGRVKELQVFDFPFMFQDMHEVDYVFYGPINDKFATLLKPLNLVLLGWGEGGFRQLSNSRRPINTADDLQGLKVRVMQNTVALETWKAMGTNAVPMSYAEVFTALETRAVDGQENALIHMYANKIYEVQKYITLTSHVYTPCAMVVSAKYWDTLTPEDQQALRQAALDAMKFFRKGMKAADIDVADKLTARGVIIAPLPPAEIAVIRERVQPVVAKFSPMIGEEFVKEFYAEIDKARQGARRPGAEE